MSNLKPPHTTTSGNPPLAPRFRHSVHQIPDPELENERPPRYEPFLLNFWFIGAVCLFMIALGIVLPVVLHISNTQNGFPVPAKNVFSFVSTQFLTTFFPTLFIVPFAYFWTVADWMLRWYQPYVTLSEGRASASRSILLDYIALNRVAVLYVSLAHRHYLIYISTLIAFSTILLQPLAGSILQVQPVPHTTDYTALVTNAIGLSPNISDLQAFFASMGFAVAAVYDNLTDPPFIHGVWTASRFQAPPGSYLNGTLAINTTAIQTEVNCVNPTSLTVTNSDGGYLASATFPGGCTAHNVFDPGNGAEQYYVFNSSSCASPGLDVAFQPVVFWFYLDDSNPQVASVYCRPTMKAFTVGTSMDLGNSLLGNCTIIEPAEGINNVTGSPESGLSYNGVLFDQSNDTYVSARAQAIGVGIPDAIYRSAVQRHGGALPAFQDQYGFLNTTTIVYTRHLAVAAQANYFLASNTTIPAQLTSNIPRLFVESLPTYILSPLVILIGFIGFVVHYVHMRARRRLWLTSPPGSIAAIVSLTSRSGFGDLLLPYDSQRRMQNNLDGLMFSLDERTGAIVAEEDSGPAESADGVALLSRKTRKRYSIVGFNRDSRILKVSDDTP